MLEVYKKKKRKMKNPDVMKQIITSQQKFTPWLEVAK